MFQQRGQDQLRNVLVLLLKHPSSRKAVIQLFNAEDIADKHKEVPCTTTLQFLRRDEKIEMIVTMRSNDAYLGFPHDVFCFTMLQEVVARTLGCDVGPYRHFVGSMHLYDWDRAEAQKLVDERFQNQIEMPSMPVGTPWPALDAVLNAEARIRAKETFDANALGVDPYWADLIRILQIFWSKDRKRIEKLRDGMSFTKYKPYIAKRMATAKGE
jgi:thymidylate synthase